MAMFTEIRRAGTYDLTTLSVALRQLRNLGLTASPQRPDRLPSVSAPACLPAPALGRPVGR